MKKINSVLLLIVALAGYSQSSETLTVSTQQELVIHSSDWSVLEHELTLENPDPHLLAGFQKIQSGKYFEALEDLGKAIESSKNSHEYIYFYRGLAKHALGDYKHAEIDFTRCLLINSIMADAYFLRALAKYEMGEYARAHLDFKKALQPGKSLLTTSTRKVRNAINNFSNNVPVDSLAEGVASY
ncbi:MAG: hypothetical protein AAF391_01000 [Bacteroidota bacterium]